MPKSTEPTSGAKPKRSPGRPLKGTERFSVNLQVRVTEELANTVKSLGGADFLRPVIEKAVQAKNTFGRNPEQVQQAAFREALKHIPKVFLPAANAPDLKYYEAGSVPCGFADASASFEVEELSLNDYFIRHENTTFLVRASGDSMIDAGILPGDLLMIEFGREPKNGDIVYALVGSDHTLKRYVEADGRMELQAENKEANYPPIRPSEFEDIQIRGVLVGSGRRYKA